MAGSININDYWVNQGQIPTLGDVEDGIEQATIEGLDATNFGTGAGIITIATSSPTAENGKAWIDTSTLAGAPELRPRIYNNASSEWLGWNILYSATEPSTTSTGWLWYDMAAKLLRVFRASAYDPNGIQGWHPISEQYQLWENRSGSIIAPGRVVVQETSSGSKRAFTTTALSKDQTVVGVTIATIGTNTRGLVATVAGGALVDIFLNVTPGTVAIGDGIVAHLNAGEGRSVGPLPSNPKPGATTMHMGMPLGCFAVAQVATTVATITSCRLLGQVGTGAIYRKAAATIAAFADGLANANWDGGWDEVNVGDYPPPGPGGTDFIANAKHKPIAAVLLNADASMDTDSTNATTLSLQLSLGPDASTAFQVVRMDQEQDQSLGVGMQSGELIVPTSAGSPYTSMGEKFYWSGTKSANFGTAAVKTANLRAVGYIY